MQRFLMLYKHLLVLGERKTLLFLFAIWIYLPMIFTNIVTIFLAAYMIVKLICTKDLTFVKDKVVMMFLLLYFIIFIGFFYPIDPANVLVDLEKKMSLFILPIALSYIPLHQKDLKTTIALFFYFGVLATSFAFALGLYNFFGQWNFDNITNHGFSMNLGMHATYLSMYLAFSLGYPIFYLPKKGRIWVQIAAILMVFYIILLSTRIIWIALTISGCIYLIVQTKNKRLKKKHYLSVLSFLLCLGAGIILVKPIKERFLEVINYNNNYNVSKVWGGRGIRTLIWESALPLIEKKPFVGYGSSTDVQEQLSLQYKQNKIGPLLYMMKEQQKFNAHNQYLEEILKYGIVLGIIYIIGIVLLMAKFYLDENWIGVFLMLIIACTSVTETIFELNKGIVFITFFVPLVHFANKKNQQYNIDPYGQT